MLGRSQRSSKTVMAIALSMADALDGRSQTMTLAEILTYFEFIAQNCCRLAELLSER
jgi:hypothetical protein